MGSCTLNWRIECVQCAIFFHRLGAARNFAAKPNDSYLAASKSLMASAEPARRRKEARAGLIIPVSRIGNLARSISDKKFTYSADTDVALAAMVETIVHQIGYLLYERKDAQIQRRAANARGGAERNYNPSITDDDLQRAIQADESLRALFGASYNVLPTASSVHHSSAEPRTPAKKRSSSAKTSERRASLLAEEDEELEEQEEELEEELAEEEEYEYE